MINKVQTKRVRISPRNNFIIIAAFSAGLGSMVTQVVILRVLLEIFNGNELVTGVILCNWMLLTASGAFLGSLWLRRSKRPPLSAIMGIAAFMPLVAVLLLNFLRNSLFQPGVMIGFDGIFITSFLLLLPFCLLNGSLFPILIARSQKSDEGIVFTNVYSSESIGSIVGGLLLGTIMVNIIGNFESLLIVTLLYLIVIIFQLVFDGKRLLALVPVSIILITVLFWFTSDIGHSARQAMYPGQEIVADRNSPFGNVVVTRQKEQISFFLNGELMFSTQNTASNEECVHFPLLQHLPPGKLLVISGDAAGIRKETAKYKSCAVEYIEENEWIIKLQKEYGGLREDENFHITNMDARLLLRQKDKVWDDILLNIGEPKNIQTNRFFTLEFFRLAKEHLSTGGVISTSLPSSENYLGREEREMHSSLFATLSKVFTNVIIIPGERDYFLASDRPLTYRIAEKADSSGMNNLYVNTGYMYESLLADQGRQITKRIDREASVNKDFIPVSCYFSLRYWLSMSGSGYLAILVVAGLLLLIPLFISKPTGSSLWTAGFTAASMEVLILMAYQSLYGHLYRMTSVVFAVFMAGLALSAYLTGFIKRKQVRLYILNQFLMGLYCLILPLMLLLFHNTGTTNFILHALIFFSTFLIALLCGVQFILSWRLRSNAASNTAGIAYGIDLLGSAAGALFVSALLLPLLGMVNVSFCIAALNIFTGLYLILRRKKL